MSKMSVLERLQLSGALQEQIRTSNRQNDLHKTAELSKQFYNMSGLISF